MTDLLHVLLFAALPAAGLFAGSLLAELVPTPKWLIGASLHATAGVAISLVSIDLMPRLLEADDIQILVIAFVIGALSSILIAGFWGTFRHRSGRTALGAKMVFMAVATDLVSDGLMVGAGSAVGAKLGLLLAATQSVANIPGGFAATSNFRDDGMPRLRRMAYALSLTVPALLSAGLGFVLLRDAGPGVQSAVLAAFMGLLLLATIEDVVPQGDEPNPPRWISTTAFTAGFALMALLSRGLG